MKPGTSRVRRRGCLLGILALVALALLAGLYVWKYVDFTGPTLVRRARPAEPPAQAAYTLSPVQQQVVELLGYPESFTLLFYQDQDEQDQFYDVRFECWHYAAASRDIVFVNGEKVSDEPAAAAVALVSAPYRPEQFTAAMRLPDVLASAGIVEYVRAAADPALVASGEVFFARQLSFGLKSGRLTAVETVPLEAGG